MSGVPHVSVGRMRFSRLRYRMVGARPVSGYYPWPILVVLVKEKTIGIIVDAVYEAQRMQSGQIEAVRAGMSGVGRRYVWGLVKTADRLVISLNVEHTVDV